MNSGEKAAKYMRKMATGCRWKVLREIHYQRTDGSEFVLKPGVWYTGIPYTQGKRKRRYSLLRFRANLLGGIFFFRKSLIGCDCSSAVSFAWRTINRGFPVLSSYKLLKDLFGEQRFVSNQDRYLLPELFVGTKEVLLGNSRKVIDESYSSLEIGDGLLQCDIFEKKGHVMLVSKKPDNGRVTIIDQKGFGEGGSEREDTSWRVDQLFTYEQLFEEGYVPIYFSFEE